MKKIMSKIKRFIDCYVPTETCNLRCHYCYIAQKRKFNNKIASFNYSSDYIRKALSVERLGGICLFNICAGGETLISDEVIDVIKELLEEGHYITIVTNGTLTKKFKMIAEFPKELLKRLIFKFSFHYLELIRLNLLDTFFENVILMKNSGASITVEITPSDELEPYIDEIKEISISKQFVEKQKAADPVRYELNTIDRKIEKFEDKKEGKHIEKIFWKKPRRRIIPASHVPLYPKES